MKIDKKEYENLLLKKMERDGRLHLRLMNKKTRGGPLD